ncbi:MAG: archease [Deltaproteobacteria bacterium]|nr:archease [Deltaproteobacteria bacterium]
MTRKSYRLLPHTADLLVLVRAPDFPSLCAASVEAVFSLLTDRGKVRRPIRRTLRPARGSPEDRLLSILRQALLLFSLDRFLVRNAGATMVAGAVEVEVRGEPMDPARHAIAREIKAVTAHGLAVGETAKGFTARFLLDV